MHVFRQRLKAFLTYFQKLYAAGFKQLASGSRLKKKKVVIVREGEIRDNDR